MTGTEETTRSKSMVNPEEKIRRIIKDEVYSMYLSSPRLTYSEWKSFRRPELEAYIAKREEELENNYVH